MIELADISVMPDVRMVRLINSGLSALLDLSDIREQTSARLQLAVEEVFVYFVHCVKKERFPRPIRLHLAYDRDLIRIRLERKGPHGDLDDCFRKSAEADALECRDMDALGLKLARGFVDSIRYTYWPLEQIHQFAITYQRKPDDKKADIRTG